MNCKIIHFYPHLMNLYGSYANLTVLRRYLELLGKSITDEQGTYEGLGLADFTAVQSARRQVIDVYGHTELFDAAIVGFLNKASVISGVERPLLTDCALGWGNEKNGGGEGVLIGNVMGSHLTGPLLVKNPRLLEHVAATICQRRGEALPASLPRIPHMEESYVAAEQQLRLRSEK